MVALGRSVAYALIFFLGSLQFGFVLNFGNLAVDGLKIDFPSWNSEKDSQLVLFFNCFSSLFGSIGGFVMLFLILLTNRMKAVVIFNAVGVVIWLLYLALVPDRLWLGITLRSIQGIEIGGLAMITPIMMTENAPEDNVGMFGCINQIGIVLGMVIFSLTATFARWKVLVIIGACVNAIYCGFIWLTPFTSKEKVDSICQKKYISPVFIGAMMMIFQQFSGMNAILDHLGVIMSASGLNLNGNLQSSISTISQLLSVFIASFNMDKCGRRSMYTFSSIGVLLSLILYIISLMVNLQGWFKALSVFLLMLFFGHGYGPIPWYICYDLLPRRARLVGQAIITFANMLSSFAVVFLFPEMKLRLGEFHTMVIFAIITFFAIPFGLFCIPNNKDKERDGVTLI